MRIQGIGSTGKFNPALKAASALTGKVGKTRGAVSTASAGAGFIENIFGGKPKTDIWATRSRMWNEFATAANMILDQPQNIGKAQKFTLSAGAKQWPAVHFGWWYKFDLGQYDNGGAEAALQDWLKLSPSITAKAPAGAGGPAVVQTGGPAAVSPTGGPAVVTETTGGRTATQEPKRAGMSPLVIGGIAAAALLGFILLRKK